MLRHVANLPIIIRLPALVAVMIFVVAVGTTQLGMVGMSRQADSLTQRLLDTYVEGVAATVQPYVADGDLLSVQQALSRAILVNLGVSDRQLILLTENGEVLARAVRDAARADPGYRPRFVVPGLPAGPAGLQFAGDGRTALGWRTLQYGDTEAAVLVAQVDLTAILDERWNLQFAMIALDLLLAGLFTLLGFFMVRGMLRPVTVLGEAIESTERGDPQNVGPAALPPPDTEFGRLLRGFNRMIDAVRERREMDAHLAAQERAALLGRLAATVAHEVRNPLGGMTTAVETARQFRDDPQAVDQSLSLIERGLASLAEVVNAALATYRTGSGDRRFGPADLDDLRVLVAPEARRRRITLNWESDIAAAMPISATEIRQVLLNLLLNACAASPPGGSVLFTAECIDDALHVTIRDAGPGMPPEIARRLIAGRQDAGHGGASGGIGVGVVMQLVRSLNGRVSVIAEAGAGTELQLYFPFENGEPAA